jgi:hypothetical protein
MDNQEKAVLKAACIQAAAILLAPLQSVRSIAQDPRRVSAETIPVSADTANCARHARDLFRKLTGEPWE